MSSRATARETAAISPVAAAEFAAAFERVVDTVALTLQGKPDVIKRAVVCLFAGGHLLIEDVPGVGKTSLAKALANAIDATSHRIQFTPDLLPSDITGVSIWNQDRHQFEFRPGPVFANIVIGDEINRASPKTQSALLEVMEEQHVTVDAVSHAVPRPFMVIATQNPVDLDGTYRLPEAQIDRFLMRIEVGYPSPQAEEDILQRRAESGPPKQVRPVLTLDAVSSLVAASAGVHVEPSVSRYVAAIAAASRDHALLRLGASPRGSLALLRVAQTWAASEGRHFAMPHDVKSVAHDVLSHRLLLTSEGEVRGHTPGEVVDALLASVPIPDETAAR